MSSHMKARQDSNFIVYARVGAGPFFEFVDELTGGPPAPLGTDDVLAAERYADFLCKRYGFTSVSFKCVTRLTYEEETAR